MRGRGRKAEAGRLRRRDGGDRLGIAARLQERHRDRSGTQVGGCFRIERSHGRDDVGGGDALSGVVDHLRTRGGIPLVRRHTTTHQLRIAPKPRGPSRAGLPTVSGPAPPGAPRRDFAWYEKPHDTDGSGARGGPRRWVPPRPRAEPVAPSGPWVAKPHHRNPAPRGVPPSGSGLIRGLVCQMVTADREHRWAVIPGIFRGQDGSRGGDEAFVQVLDGRTGSLVLPPIRPGRVPRRHRSIRRPGGAQPLPQRRRRIAPAGTSRRGALRLPAGSVAGLAVGSGCDGLVRLGAGDGVLPPVVSFGHALSGTLRVEDGEVDFAGDGATWRRTGAPPSRRLHLVAQQHLRPHRRLAHGLVRLIPWRGRQFRGFIVGLRHGGRLDRFATYTRARSLQMHVDDDSLVWRLRSARRPGRTPLSLEVRADRPAGGLLHAPIRTEMHRRVEETLDARIEVTLRRGSGGAAQRRRPGRRVGGARRHPGPAGDRRVARPRQIGPHGANRQPARQAEGNAIM